MRPFIRILVLSLCLALTLAVLPTIVLHSAEKPGNKPLKVGVVNFTTCVEKSKLGQQEQETFEAMKKQMETILQEKEKVLTEMSNKLEDSDFVDSLSVETETEMKRKYRALAQELSMVQNQYLQTLQQANVKIIQRIADVIAKASEKVAEQEKFDLLINKDSSFYNTPELDVSDLVAKEMDVIFEQEKKAAPATDTTSGTSATKPPVK